MNDIHDAHASEIVREALFPTHRSPVVTSEANFRPMTAEDARKAAVSVLLNSKSMVPILHKISKAVQEGQMVIETSSVFGDQVHALHALGYKTSPSASGGINISW